MATHRRKDRPRYEIMGGRSDANGEASRGDRNAPPAPRNSAGLFHLAVLYPNRRELARALRWLVDAEYPLDGASDHGVSEALYLTDPDGNGVELYRDRPREEWPKDPEGGLAMVTIPLDVADLLAELDEPEPEDS